MSGIVVSAEVTNPDLVDVTLTVRMRVKDWQEVVDALADEQYGARWFAAEFCTQIRQQLRAVEHKALGISHPPQETHNG